MMMPTAPLDELSIADSQDDSGDTALSPNAVPRAAENILLRHVRVNAIADYYDIPALKELANSKIKHVIDTTWTVEGFPDVVREVFRFSADVELREITTSTIVAHIEDLAELHGFAELDVLSDLGVDIIQRMVLDHKVKQGLLLEELQELRSELQQADIGLQCAKIELIHGESRRDELEGIIDRINKNVDNCHDILSDTISCRNSSCKAEFTCYIERGGTSVEPKYTLRCSKCRCRHK
jgi:hypothetical protein